MEAERRTVDGIFNSAGNVHFVLPRFQRSYAWTKKNWATFWKDVLKTHNHENDRLEHFLGTIVVIEEGKRDEKTPVFTLVDGQQRLVTISILFCALAEKCAKESATYREIRRYLENVDRDGDYSFKVLPTEHSGDREAWKSIVKDRLLRGESQSRIKEAYVYFQREVAKELEKNRVNPEGLFYTVLNKLSLVVITMDRTEQPHQIFESLNAKGVPLTQPDLVRNYIAMHLPENQQEEIFNNYWRPLEKMLHEPKKGSKGERTAFIRHYLASISGNVPRERDVYEKFREHANEYKDNALVEEIHSLHRFAVYYERFLRPANEPDPNIRLALERLRTLEQTTIYPPMLKLYSDYDTEKLETEALIECLRIIENYLVRRYLAGISTRSLSRIFAALVNRVFMQEGRVESLWSALSVQNYPSDDQIRQYLQTQQTGGNRSILAFILTEIDKSLGGDVQLKDNPTIEHIMPQTPNASWEEHLGLRWQEIHRGHHNTLGNLTIVTQEWNSSASNKAFLEKKKLLAEHGLPINKEYFSQEIHKWEKRAILERTDWLVERILEIWPDFKSRYHGPLFSWRG